jgi:(p)ppGpp synthase/HD superfamily hydrolase
MLNYLRAFIIALIAHWGQKDKGGHPYFFHPFRVSQGVKSLRVKVVALLHDVLEDSEKFNFSDFYFLDEEQKEAIKLLTHNKSVDYFDYIQEVKKNMIAREVKLADLNDNMNLSRLKEITEKDKRRYDKYKTAKNCLLN